MHYDDVPGRLGELLRYGRIASVDLAAGRITVAVGDIETAPIRFFTGAAGGTRIWSRPRIGEQVMLLAPEGDIAGAIALRGIVSTANPPIADTDREVVAFEDGATIAYDPAGHALALVLPAGATVSIVAPGGVTLDCDVRISGDLVVDGKADVAGDMKVDGKADIAGDVKGRGISLPDHVHLGVQTGTGISGKPQ